MYQLSDELWFPNPAAANSDGLLAIGGDLSEARLMLAYNSGIFPWFEKNQPILWWSPDPRMVLFPHNFKLSKSLRQTLRSGKFRITFNEDFEQIITQCAKFPRQGKSGTWIIKKKIEAYLALHRTGHALSIEIWQEGAIVGVLYGIDLPQK